MNPRRMEAEAVRDNVLRVSGNLDPTLGGPDLDPEAGLTSPRRSLYFRHAKEKRVTFLRLFDSSNVQSCYRRTRASSPSRPSPWRTARSARPGPAARRDGLGRASGDDPAFVAAASAASWAGSRRPTNGPSASPSWPTGQALAEDRSSRPSPRAPAPVPPSNDPPSGPRGPGSRADQP